MNEKSLLIHICCAPCLSGLSDYLKSRGFTSIKGYFFNPNIHPYREFKKRRHQVRMSEKLFGFDEIEYSDEYNLNETLNGMMSSENRCEYCFRMRLSETARKARSDGFTHFTTTLLISPYQDQELLKNIGNEMAEKHNLKFVDEDLRRFFDLSRHISHEEEMYRQGYCGCIFSEYERYGIDKQKRPCESEDD